MTKQNYNLKLAIEGRSCRMSIGIDVVRVLGCPEYTTFKVKKDMSCLAIYPCKEKEEPSFKVPNNLFQSGHCPYRVNSKSFITDLYTANNLDIQKNYYLIGVYSEEKNAVIFNLNNAQLQKSIQE